MRATCDIGGNYSWPDPNGPAVYHERCELVAAVRYRERAEQPWGHRCGVHAAWLDRARVEVEAVS